MWIELFLDGAVIVECIVGWDWCVSCWCLFGFNYSEQWLDAFVGWFWN